MAVESNTPSETLNGNIQKVEAVLFAIGKEVTIERLACLCSLTEPEVKVALDILQQRYQELNLSFYLIAKDNGWKLSIKDDYLPLVSSIVTSTELEKPLMETLAVIAWKYPIVQSEVIKLRTPAAYGHMRQLEEQGFIAKERHGRTFRVRLTKKFFEYFDLPSEQAKQAFLKEVPSEILKEAEEVSKETDEVERLIELGKKEGQSKEEIKRATESVK